MERQMMDELVRWKARENRKPLLLKGARQTGKTWLLKEFGRRMYDSFIHINLDRNPDIAEIFAVNKNPEDIIRKLEYATRKKIEPGKTLVILDEIQASRAALNSLKYFKEEAPEYHIASAGSLLGIYLSGLMDDRDWKRDERIDELTVPVGAVDVMHLYPMTFQEFLLAVDDQMHSFYSSITKGQHIENIFHERLNELYNLYLIVGGMPECVASWAQNRDFDELDRIQDALVELYEYDVTKYHGRINPDKILLVFRRLVSQLAKPNEKFIYGALRKGARATEYEGAIEWLCSAGLVNRVYNVTRPEFPLKAYEDISAFKLFFFDTGLLKHMAQLDNSPLLTKTSYQFKGPLSENFVLQQLTGQFPATIAYYSTKNMEIDFLLQAGSRLIPMEVKGEEDRRAPSFKRYLSEHEPDMAIRFSKMGYQDAGSLTNMPLYLASRLKDLI